MRRPKCVHIGRGGPERDLFAGGVDRPIELPNLYVVHRVTIQRVQRVGGTEQDESPFGTRCDDPWNEILQVRADASRVCHPDVDGDSTPRTTDHQRFRIAASVTAAPSTDANAVSKAT